MLLVTAFLMPLGTFAVMQARLDLLVEDSARAALETFAAAEVGLEHTLADLELDPSFDRLLAGPDGIVGNADDDRFRYVRSQPPLMLEPPLRYEVTVERLGPNIVELTSQACGFRDSRRAVAARVTRSADAALPSAVFSAATALDVALGPDFVVNGADRAGRDAPRPGLMVADDATRERTLANLPSGAAAHLVGRDGAPSIEAADYGTLLNRVAAAASDPRAVLVGPPGTVGDGLQVSEATLVLDGDVQGSGLLLVEGDLEVAGGFSFSGLIFVRGDVRFAPGSDAHVTGCLLQSPDGRRLDLLGAGEVAYDSRAVTDLDDGFPGILPRGVTMVGWREVF